MTQEFKKASKLWRGMTTISIEKAAYLSLDLEPSREYSPDKANAIFQRIKQAILEKKLVVAKEAYIQKSKSSSYLAPDKSEYQQPNCSQTTDWINTTVTMESFKSWLEHDLKTKPSWLFDPDEETPVNAPPMPKFESTLLTVLNQAAIHFWADIDPKDKKSYPKNVVVTEWLISQGFTKK